MKFKILCSDLDGTLLTTKNDVSDFTVAEINRIKNRMKVILVSARMPQSMIYLQSRLGIEQNPMVCFNGALVLHQNTTLANTMISIANTKILWNHCQNSGIRIGLYHRNDWCVSVTSERVEKEIFNTKAQPRFEKTEDTLNRWELDGIGPHKIMLMGSKAAMDDIAPILESRFKEDLNCYRSNDTLIEIAPKSVSKLQAIKSLLKDEESLNDVLAFGDNFNDVEMLQNVGCGVAVANAREAAKKASNFVTSANTEDGVAQFIKTHL